MWILGVLIILLGAVSVNAGVTFEQCNARNSYLDSAIQSASQLSPLSCVDLNDFEKLVATDTTDVMRVARLQTRQIPSPACVLEALKDAPQASAKAGDFYLSCRPLRATSFSGSADSPAHWLKKGGVPRPCASAALVDWVYEAYMNSMTCLGLDPAEMFPVFKLESSFEVNFMSPFGLGVGQVTGVSALSPKYIRGQIGGSSPACQYVRSQFVPFVSKPLDHCAAAQPVTGFVLAGLVYKSARIEAQGLVAKIQKKYDLSAEDAKALTVYLARTIYNGGDRNVVGSKSFGEGDFAKATNALSAARLPKAGKAAAIEKAISHELYCDTRVHNAMGRTMAGYDFSAMKQARGVERVLRSEGRADPCFERYSDGDSQPSPAELNASCSQAASPSPRRARHSSM